MLGYSVVVSIDVFVFHCCVTNSHKHGTTHSLCHNSAGQNFVAGVHGAKSKVPTGAVVLTCAGSSTGSPAVAELATCAFHGASAKSTQASVPGECGARDSQLQGVEPGGLWKAAARTRQLGGRMIREEGTSWGTQRP